MKKLTYIVDIDRTVFNTVNGDFHNAVGIPDRIAQVNKLYREGHTVIYWTGRDSYSGKSWHEFTRKQLSHYGCEYTELRSDKPHYDLWIDDKAVSADDFFKKPSQDL